MAKNKTTKRGIPKRRANKPTEGRNKLYTLCIMYKNEGQTFKIHLEGMPATADNTG